jgi:hypothetical protein
MPFARSIWSDFLSGGTGNPQLCAAGRYCDGMDFAIPGTACAKGRYSSAIGAKSSATCAICPIGSYCPSDGTITPARCSLGYTTSGEGSILSSSCEACVPSTFYSTTKDTGNPFCEQCPAGTFCPSSASLFPTQCPAGSFCSSQGASLHALCPPGTYAPSTGSRSCLDCPFGTYCNTSGTVQPRACPRGYYCPQTKAVAPTPCSVGYHCPTDGMFNEYPCPTGHYCPRSALVDPVPCPAGQYSAQTGQQSADTCIKCPKGDLSITICRCILLHVYHLKLSQVSSARRDRRLPRSHSRAPSVLTTTVKLLPVRTNASNAPTPKTAPAPAKARPIVYPQLGGPVRFCAMTSETRYG